MIDSGIFERISEFIAPLTPRGHAILFLSASLLAAGLLAGPDAAPKLLAAGVALFLLIVVEREIFLARAAALSRVKVRWAIEHPLVEGRRVTVKIILENPGLIPIEHLEVYDMPPRLFRWDKSTPPRAVVVLPALGVTEVSYSVIPVVGKHEWVGPLRLIVEDLFGFFRAERLIETRLPIVNVQPRTLDIPGRRSALPTVLQPGGVTRLRRRGIGTEFMELREYSPDDDIRLVDWKASARTGRLMVKVFEQESVLRVAIVLDALATMFRGVLGETKIEYAARLVASLSEYLARRGDTFRIYLVDPQGTVYASPWLHGRASGSAARRFVAEKLAWPQADEATQPPQARAEAIASVLLRTLPRGKTIVFLISDFGEEEETAVIYASALARLQALRHEVYAVSPLTTLFEASALQGTAAAVYRLLAYEKIKTYMCIFRELRRHGVHVAAAGPSDLLTILLERLERMRCVTV